MIIGNHEENGIDASRMIPTTMMMTMTTTMMMTMTTTMMMTMTTTMMMIGGSRQ